MVDISNITSKYILAVNSTGNNGADFFINTSTYLSNGWLGFMIWLCSIIFIFTILYINSKWSLKSSLFASSFWGFTIGLIFSLMKSSNGNVFLDWKYTIMSLVVVIFVGVMGFLERKTQDGDFK